MPLPVCKDGGRVQVHLHLRVVRVQCACMLRRVVGFVLYKKAKYVFFQEMHSMFLVFF